MRLLIVAALVALPACPKPKPTPIPTPKPPDKTEVPAKGVPLYPERLLQAVPGEHRLRLPDGTAFEPVQYIPCCMAFTIDGQDVPSFWPLVGERFIAHTKELGAGNMYHRRFGPFLTSEEPEWATIGGPKLPDGSVNQAFWDENRRIAWGGLLDGVWFEDVPMDQWGFKVSQAGRPYIAMSAEAIAAYGHSWHPEHEAYLRKYVEEMGCFGNIIIALDNEGTLVRNYDPEFYRVQLRRYRELEREVGCGFKHLVGTSIPELFGEVDYAITHSRTPLVYAISGLPTFNNERNPNYEPSQEISIFADARALHLVWSLWRAGLTEAEYLEVMAGVKAIVEGLPATCPALPPDGPLWEQLPAGPGSWVSEVYSAEQDLGSQCKEPKSDANCDAANDKLVAKLREKGACAYRSGDKVTILSKDGSKWEAYHSCAPHDSGCWSVSTKHYPESLWKWNGEAPPPPPPSGCPSPLPDRAKLEWSLKCGVWCDATPLVTKSCDYCEAIGMGEINGTIRCGCPARNECPGFQCEKRVVCEQYLIEAESPIFRSDGTIIMDPNSAWRAKQQGGTYIEVCNGPLTKCTRVNQ